MALAAADGNLDLAIEGVKSGAITFCATSIAQSSQQRH
jgi:hypothetical protein